MSDPTYVYLFRAANGLYKIGRSQNPKRRLADFWMSPIEVSLAHQIETDDSKWLEADLHRTYAACRVRGEWFSLSEGEVLKLMGIRARNRPKDIQPDERPRERMVAITADAWQGIAQLAHDHERSVNREAVWAIRRYVAEEEAKLNTKED